MSENRRSAHRHDIAMPARLAVDGQLHEATIQNISLGGAQLAFSQRLAMGTRVKLLFDIPKQNASLEIGATVRWSTTDSIGLQFEGLRARDVWTLNKFFESLA